MPIVTKNTNVWLYSFSFISMATPWGHTLQSIMDNITKHLCVGAKPYYIYKGQEC